MLIKISFLSPKQWIKLMKAHVKWFFDKALKNFSPLEKKQNKIKCSEASLRANNYKI